MVTDNGNTTPTDYAGNFIYEDGQLRMFFQPEGYVEPNGNGGFEYVYQYKDHLGNIRLSYKKDEQNSIFDKDDFENGTEGWSSPQSPSSVGAGGGALIVNLSSNGDNTHKSFSIIPNKSIHIEFKLNAGIINHISGNAKVYFSEYVNGAWETYANSDSFPLGPGLFKETLTFGSNQIKVSFVRTTTSTESVNFLMPYFVLEQNALQILDEKNYYPFGMEHQGYNSSVTGVENNYQTYQGKEIEKELGLNTIAFGWRDYDPAIARFNKIDRFAEKYYSISNYAFSTNNPIFYREIKGDSINVSKIYEQAKNGDYLHENLIKSFEEFIQTEEGYKYLSQFASEGQVIAGVEFKSNGKYHKKGIDLNFDTNLSREDGRSGETSVGKNHNGNPDKNGRFQIDVSLNANADVVSNVGQITHEFFIHAVNYAKDIQDNSTVDYSNMSDFVRKNYSESSMHHYQAWFNNQEGISPYANSGYPILININKKFKTNKTNEEIWNNMWGFSY